MSETSTLDCLRQQNWPRGVSARTDAYGNRNTPTHSASPDCRSAGGNPSPPDLVLIPHCAECEFQTRCRQKAEEKDDLSLLSGMTEKERRNLHDKGIFTVTQLYYTFRPRPEWRHRFRHALGHALNGQDNGCKTSLASWCCEWSLRCLDECDLPRTAHWNATCSLKTYEVPSEIAFEHDGWWRLGPATEVGSLSTVKSSGSIENENTFIAGVATSFIEALRADRVPLSNEQMGQL